MDEKHVDREAPTPRLTAAWQLQAELAQALSERLLARELALSRLSNALDSRRAASMRHLRYVIDYYGSRFRLWPADTTITLEQKARELAEFSALMTATATIIEP